MIDRTKKPNNFGSLLPHIQFAQVCGDVTTLMLARLEEAPEKFSIQQALYIMHICYTTLRRSRVKIGEHTKQTIRNIELKYGLHCGTAETHSENLETCEQRDNITQQNRKLLPPASAVSINVGGNHQEIFQKVEPKDDLEYYRDDLGLLCSRPKPQANAKKSNGLYNILNKLKGGSGDNGSNTTNNNTNL